MASTGLRALFSKVEADDVPWAGGSLRVGPLDRLDRFTLGLITLVFLLLLVNINHLKPSMSDTWYHVNVAQQFRAEGGITGWDMSDYAPTGRPHLYPPLLHLLLVTLAAFTGGVMHASQLCAALFLPLGLLTTWVAARRLVNSTVALLAVLLVLTDLIHFVIMEAHIAGCLINILLPLFLVTFLARRAWWSILLLTLMLYSHLGFPVCVVAGLLLFGFKYRSYGRLALKVTGISLLFFSPWLAHVLGHLDWLPVLSQGGMPGDPLKKLLSLQSFNLLLLGLGFWGIALAPRRQPQRMIPIYMLIGFLPILFAYGGRYTMHTMPLWALLGATVITRLLPPPHTFRRVVGIMLLTLLPWPTVSFMNGVKVLPLTTPHMLAIITAKGGPAFEDGQKSEAYRPDCDEVAAWLRGSTAPDEVVYTNTVWMAEMIALLAQRRTDFGAWWECSKEQEKIEGKALRDWLPRATFVYIKPSADAGSVLWETPTMPGVDHLYEIGRFRIGLRDPHWLVRTGAKVSRWRALSVAGSAGNVTSEGESVRWTFPAKRDRLAIILANAPSGSFAGAKLRLASSAMADDLVFGLRTPDGRDYRWPLALALPEQSYNVRVIFDWMLDAKGQRWPGGPISQVYFACPAGQKAPGKTEGDRTLEVMQVELARGGRSR
jgi:hypothetical protein